MFSSKKLMVPLIQESCERLNEKISTVSITVVTCSVDVFGLLTMEVILVSTFGKDVDTQKGNVENLLVEAAACFNI